MIGKNEENQISQEVERVKNFDELRKKIKDSGKTYQCVVAGATDHHALESVFDLEKEGILEPILVGEKGEIEAALEELHFSDRTYKIVDCPSDVNPAVKAVEEIRAGRGDFILKGKLHTKDVLIPILNKEKGLNSHGFITHLGLLEMKNYHKLLAISDSAIIPNPDFETKKKIIKLCGNTLNKLGIKNPIIGALSSLEVINTKIPETVEAAKLKELSDKGEFGNCRVIGPISFDLATDKEAVEIKKYEEEGAANVDMLLVPQMTTGNVMSKILSRGEGNTLAGCVVGADIPVALTSRSATAIEKEVSLLLCCALAEAH